MNKKNGGSKLLKRGNKFLCKIKWWDKRDGNGIACEIDGSEFYIDSSAFKQNFTPADGDFIFLRENLSIAHCRSGLDVVRARVTDFTKSEFQIASTLRFAMASMCSAQKQVIRLRKMRMAS